MGRRCALILGLLVVLPGCSTTMRHGTEALADDSVVKQIEIGSSTMADVRGLLGEPQAVDLQGEGRQQWVYLFTSSSTNTGAAMVPVVGALALKTEIQTRTLSVLFDASGVVEDTYLSDRRQEHTPTGGMREVEPIAGGRDES